MSIDLEEVVKRRAVWTIAKEMVEPIVEEHGLESYGTGGNIFATPNFKYTKVDQHIDKILQTADWLMNDG